MWNRGPAYGPMRRGARWGFGPGWAFIDENGNGVCDRFEGLRGGR
jgi:hypothetical protein